ncbi:MAG: ATP synthase F1 subunit delta [Chloroflexi bacterium]|nr:ATP synthase F1 subunit delta [Chloroflexota bacterium]
MAVTRNVAGRRYAVAVADLARERGDWEVWARSVEAFAQLTADAAYVGALAAESLSDERFQAILQEAVPQAGPLQMNLFRLLRRKRRLALGPSIASYFGEMWDIERGVVRAELRTAVALSDERRQQIADDLSRRGGGTVELTAMVDPALLGGAVVRIGDRLIDGSARTRLRALRAQLVAGG